MTSNQVHPEDGRRSECVDGAAHSSIAPHVLPMKFCSLFTAEAVKANGGALPGLVYQLLPRDGAANVQSLRETLLNVAKRHTRYQFLMNFKILGSRFSAALSILYHVICILIYIFLLLFLYHGVTSNNGTSNGASSFCSLKCANAGVCSTFEATSGSDNSSSSAPPNSCSCLPGYYGTLCDVDRRSSDIKKTEYSFSTKMFKNVYEYALVYLIFITFLLCLQFMALLHSIQAAVRAHDSIKRIQPVNGSVRYYSFSSSKGSSDPYGCSSFQQLLSPIQHTLSVFGSATEIDVLNVMFENAPRGTFMVSYKWGGWSQSVARSFFYLLPGVWLDIQNLLPGQVVTTACAHAASHATVVFVFLSRNYVSRKNCMCEMNALIDIHCGATPSLNKHAVVFVLSEALEPTDSWVVNDDANRTHYESILQRLRASPSVTIIYWEHSNMSHNWGILKQPVSSDGNLQILVNKFRFNQMDGQVLLQLLAAHLRSISSKIVLHGIPLDASAFNSPLVSRVFYALLPRTASEQQAESTYPLIFDVLQRVEPSFANLSHCEDYDAADVSVTVDATVDNAEHDYAHAALAPGAGALRRFGSAIWQSFSYFHMFPFLTCSTALHESAIMQLVCDLHRHWANLLSITLDSIKLHSLASLQFMLANTAQLAQKCCTDGSTGRFSFSRFAMESVDFFKVKLWFRPTIPIVSLLSSSSKIVVYVMYMAILLGVLYSFCYTYMKPELDSTFTTISNVIFGLNIAGASLFIFSEIVTSSIYRKLTLPLVFGHPIFSLLHDALLLRQTHKPLHPFLLSSDHESDCNVIAALTMQTPICSATRFLLKHGSEIPPEEDGVFRRMSSRLAGAARQALQNGVFPAVSVGSGCEVSVAGAPLSKVMQDKPFRKLLKVGVLEPGYDVVDWWCGFNILGKRFAILHRLGLAPTIKLVYVSDYDTPALDAAEGVPLAQHLPLHDSGPLGM
jgi:hypothetical protein